MFSKDMYYRHVKTRASLGKDLTLQYESFKNTVGKGESARKEQFLFFPQRILPFWRTFCHFNQTGNYLLQTLSVWKSLIYVVWESINTRVLKGLNPDTH